MRDSRPAADVRKADISTPAEVRQTAGPVCAKFQPPGLLIVFIFDVGHRSTSNKSVRATHTAAASGMDPACQACPRYSPACNEPAQQRRHPHGADDNDI